MKIQKKYMFLSVLFLFLSVYVLASEANKPKVEIKAYSSEIKIGEPLILEIRAISKTPNINPETKEIITSGGISSPYLIINKKGQKEEIKYEYQLNTIHKPFPIFEKGNKGLEYTGTFIAFYNQNKKELLFNEPGDYSCRFESTIDKLESNTVEITVKPAGNQEEKTMSILTGKYDKMILEMPEGIDNTILKEDPGVLNRFEQIIEQCGDTMIAKIAAAQLGIMYFKDFHEKYFSFEDFREEYKTGNVQEPLFEKSLKYLTIGSQLPDEFPIRQEVLFQLSRIEFMQNNLDKSISLIDEIASKYPNTEYGKQAIKAQQEEIPKLKTEIGGTPEQVQVTKEEQTQKKPLGVALPIAGAAVAVIAIAGLILFTRKKKLEK